MVFMSPYDFFWEQKLWSFRFWKDFFFKSVKLTKFWDSPNFEKHGIEFLYSF